MSTVNSEKSSASMMTASKNRIEKNKNLSCMFTSKALIDVCEENNALRSEVLQSRRKTEQLKIENDDMKEAIIELADAIQFMTENP